MMPIGPSGAALMAISARTFRRWIVHLGGFGLIALGLLDSSIVPVPGSMDLATIVLCAREPAWWPYYALMATIGSVAGGLLTYRLARRGGTKALERRVPSKRLARIHASFKKWGFGAIAIPAILPPPMPMVPFLLAAGATDYPLKRFLAAFSLGRIVRYSVLGYLSGRYGRRLVRSILESGRPIAVLAGVAVAAALAGLLYWRGSRRTARTAS